MILISYLKDLFAPRPPAPPAPPPPQFSAPLVPERPFAAVGDIHGRADLLRDLVGQLGAQAGTDWPLVFLGDYIDRGEHSAAVLAHLQELQAGGWPGEMICLMGNHEAMMLEFLEHPEEAGRRWLRNGGAHTLVSFEVPLPGPAPEALCEARDALRAALGPATEAWLRALPLCFRSGNVFAAHAGADPQTPLEAQQEEHLLWGHPAFLQTPRADGIWVVHGHTICDRATAEQGRISVDTGAYATHRLSAALIQDEQCRFITT